MGKSILISDADTSLIEQGGTGFAYQTTTFEVIVEGTRAHFLAGEEVCLKTCFIDYDDYGQEYLSLYDVEPFCFNTFVRACEAGLEELKHSREVAIDYATSPVQVDGFIAEWEALIEELHRDARYAASKRRLG